MKKGGRPTARISRHRAGRKRKMPARKRTGELPPKKCRSSQPQEAVCPSTVARAAPRIPHPKENMNSGASAIFTATLTSAVPMALTGCPEARMTLFSPSMRKPMGSPASRTTM